MTDSDSIMIRCEGSGCPANPGGTCTMCGSYTGVATGETVPEHQRDDILARLHRGDFDS